MLFIFGISRQTVSTQTPTTPPSIPKVKLIVKEINTAKMFTQMLNETQIAGSKCKLNKQKRNAMLQDKDIDIILYNNLFPQPYISLEFSLIVLILHVSERNLLVTSHHLQLTPRGTSQPTSSAPQSLTVKRRDILRNKSPV